MERYIRVAIRYRIGFKMITGVIDSYRRHVAETVRKAKLQDEMFINCKEQLVIEIKQSESYR